MKILRAADHRRMAWKNGGGETTEIAVFPEGAGLDDFAWRVSMARVDVDGPFSKFPGIDRTLAILEGEGVTLKIERRIPIGLTPDSWPLSFPADVPTEAQLFSGPILDLNVMSRRGKVRHEVVRYDITADNPLEFDPVDAEAILICTKGRLRISIAGKTPVMLSPYDASVQSSPVEETLVECEVPSQFFAILFNPWS